MRFASIAAILLAPIVAAAQAKKDAPKIEPIPEIKLDRKDPVVYEKDIEPIFANKCTYCHSGNVVESKFDMSTYDKLMKGGKRGAAITAGNAQESTLYKMASWKMTPVMPPVKEEQKLSPQELALVKLWIDQGAKPPTGKVEKKAVTVGFPPAGVKPVRAVSVAADGKLIAASRSNQVFLFNPADGKAVKTLADPALVYPDKKPANAAHVSLVEAMAFSPDAKKLVTGSFQEVTLWDVEKGTGTKITGFADRVVALAWSPDGKYFATGGGAPTEDGEMKIFDANGKEVFAFKSPHSDTVFGVCFSADNTKLASCGADKFVKTWEVPSGKFLKAFEGHTHHVLDVGWFPDGKQLASAGADNNVKIWDFEKGEQVRTVNAHQKQVTRLLFIGKSGNFITTSGDQNVKMWNSGGNNMRSFAGGTDFVYAVSASGDGKIVVTGGEEGIIRMYNGDQGGQPSKILYPPGEEPPAKEEPKKK